MHKQSSHKNTKKCKIHRYNWQIKTDQLQQWLRKSQLLILKTVTKIKMEEIRWVSSRITNRTKWKMKISKVKLRLQYCHIVIKALYLIMIHFVWQHNLSKVAVSLHFHKFMMLKTAVFNSKVVSEVIHWLELPLSWNKIKKLL